MFRAVIHAIPPENNNLSIMFHAVIHVTPFSNNAIHFRNKQNAQNPSEIFRRRSISSFGLLSRGTTMLTILLPCFCANTKVGCTFQPTWSSYYQLTPSLTGCGSLSHGGQSSPWGKLRRASMWTDPLFRSSEAEEAKRRMKSRQGRISWKLKGKVAKLA